ncbi:hypothetical protein G7Z17_g5057 [Cylindrodendrum hubeiense]|uniref:H-type lectin domain-containing protein n=1 Tax=Cylindrodendrum hubeiense TaxID=595255 RepID=A0A9P5HCM4_9HYPO|nr:hypothetical protein G7Z17_g5057 [Cylindrodendrum hubeiense]
MALLLAPYNNGMRLGQGFNSYTQQICIDDAVVIDPDRVDNAVTNDGFTMRELRQAMGARAGDERDDFDEDEYLPLPRPLPQPILQPAPTITAPPVTSTITDTTTAVTAAGTTTDVPAKTPPMIGPAPPTVLDSMMIQLNQDAQTISKLVGEIATLEATIEEATDAAGAKTKQDALLLEKKRMRLARLKLNGSGMKTAKSRNSARELSQRGPSQIVSYSSRFVNKISEITEDMNISGSLSIKYGAIGGSGKGSFVDSDKFKESDLNFFISVKVVNQSINIKDALVFQGLPSVDGSNFLPVFGNCFISGFLEGGEFNALVSMKVINKEKLMAIKAEAEIAMTAGAADIKADAHVEVNKSNFSSQTETTIQPWTIETLMETAARFPDLVANTPQRTNAILTKYESLRSFMALQPPRFQSIYYENAAIYTNSLLDAYMDYKNIYRTIGTYIFDIQAGTKIFEPWPTSPATKLSDSTTLSSIDEDSKFEATPKGLDLARRACRFQMIKIVTEVDQIERDASKAANESRPEAYQSPVVFRQRLPLVKDKQKMPHLEIYGTNVPYPSLLDRLEGDGVTDVEVTKASSYAIDQPDVGKFQRLAPMVGSANGTLFCNLDFVKPDFSLRTITIEMNGGVVAGLSVRYANGLLATMGTMVAMGTPSKGNLSLTVNPANGEKIIACSIETGRVKDDANAPTRVTAIRMYTNRGPDLLGNADDWNPAVNGKGTRGGVKFEDLVVKHFDPLLVNSHIKGFWGYGVTTQRMTSRSGIYRLAPIWGSKEDKSAAVSELTDQIDETKPKSGHVAVDLSPHTSETKKVATTLENVSKEGFDVRLHNSTSSNSHIEANWMTLPDNDIRFEQGEVDTTEFSDRQPTQNASFRIHFSKPYKTVPKVVCWFTRIHQPHGWRSLRCDVANITTHACTINVVTWASRQFDSAKVMWLAWDSENDGVNIRSGLSEYSLNAPVSEGAWYNGPFARQPEVFTGIKLIDFGDVDTDFKVYAEVQSATKERLKWHGGTWDGAIMSANKSVYITGSALVGGEEDVIEAESGFVIRVMRGWTLNTNCMVATDFQHGIVRTAEVTRTPQHNASFRIYFARPYLTEPKVMY